MNLYFSFIYTNIYIIKKEKKRNIQNQKREQKKSQIILTSNLKKRNPKDKRWMYVFFEMFKHIDCDKKSIIVFRMTPPPSQRERDDLITPNKCFFSINTLKHIKTYTHCFFYLQIFFEDDKKNEWSLNVFLFFHVLVFSFFRSWLCFFFSKKKERRKQKRGNFRKNSRQFTNSLETLLCFQFLSSWMIRHSNKHAQSLHPKRHLRSKIRWFT